MTFPEDRFTNTVSDASRYERYRAECGDLDGLDYDDWHREHSIWSKHEDEDYVASLEDEGPCGCGDYYCEECA